jgi:predicted DNA-binding antitoxin AbrB/MazE fold protein
MAITVEAVYEKGVLKPTQPLPLKEHDRVQITVRSPVPSHPPMSPAEREELLKRFYGLIGWKGTHEELQRLLEEAEEPEELPLAPPSGDQPRPYGLCAGEFTVPDDFDQPLPEKILSDFEGR